MTISNELDARSPSAPLPHDLAELLRPELESLTTEIVHEIRATIPAYDHSPNSPYGESITAGVEYALTLFVDQIADPAVPKDESLELHRNLGRQELRQDRNLNNLMAAYRLGSRVAWRRLMNVGARAGLSSAVMSELADALLAFMDELTTVALDGYLQAKAATDEAREEWRQQLLRRILEQPPAPHAALTELARPISWTIPTRVSLVAVETRRTGSRNNHPDRLDHDVLATVDSSAPHLLVPDTVTDARLATFQAALPGRRICIGPCVPLESAAESLRLARTALALAKNGVIPKQRIIWAEQHLSAVLLHGDEALLDQLRRRWFGPLNALTPKQQERITTTLHAWLDAQGSVPDIAERLGVHTQTVRYRLRQLEATFGEHLHDPDARFEMHLVLRADSRRQAPRI